MKKIILVFSILVSFLFSFSNKTDLDIKKEKVFLLNNKEDNCNVEEAIVNITTTNNLINVSGFIVYSDLNNVYIATSYKNYNKGYNYEVVLNDYSRKKASVVGYALKDEVLLLKIEKENKQYCSVKFSKSEYMNVSETVTIIGKENYQTTIINTTINSIGLCKNCSEDTYKKYYHTLLSVVISDNLFGAGVFDQKNQLLGIVINKFDKFKDGISVLDVNKLKTICYDLINEGKYNKNYIKYNLLDVNSLTNHEKYLYSLDEGVTSGVLVSSIHYLNYIKGGLNQGALAELFNISPGRAYYMIKSAKSYHLNTIKENLNLLNDLELKIKSGKIDQNLGLELYLLN